MWMDETLAKSDELDPLPFPEDQPTIPLWPTVGRQFGLGRTATFEAHKRNEFPFPVWRVGNRLVCPTAAVRLAFGLPTNASPNANALAHTS